MYFKFFKLQSWDKRSASYRRRLIQRFLKGMGFPIPGLGAYILSGCPDRQFVTSCV